MTGLVSRRPSAVRLVPHFCSLVVIQRFTSGRGKYLFKHGIINIANQLLIICIWVALELAFCSLHLENVIFSKRSKVLISRFGTSFHQPKAISVPYSSFSDSFIACHPFVSPLGFSNWGLS